MITAKILPFAFVLVFGIAAGIGGTLSITKAVKPEIKLECPQPVCPQPKCDCSSNAVDIDKLKNFKGTFSVQQHYHVEMNGDSLVVKAIISEMEAKLNQLRLARCK